jgi:hypothetical protein
MRTETTTCDQCGKQWDTDNLSLLFIRSSSTRLSIFLPAKDQNAKQRDFCGKECLRDFLNDNFPKQCS